MYLEGAGASAPGTVKVAFARETFFSISSTKRVKRQFTWKENAECVVSAQRSLSSTSGASVRKIHNAQVRVSCRDDINENLCVY